MLNTGEPPDFLNQLSLRCKLRGVTPTVMEEDAEFLNGACTVLESIGSNLNDFVTDRGENMSFVEPEPGDRRAEIISQTHGLKDETASLLGSIAVLKKEGADKIDEIQNRYDELHKRWMEQQDQLGRAQDEIIRLRNQVMHQSTFCASLGAVLGNLVWQASRSTRVIDEWLSRVKVGEFLCIVNGTFVSFINTYGSVFPSDTSDESQFVMGLCGIVTNLSSIPKGRQFLVTNPNGKDLLRKIVELTPLVPLPSGSLLARLMVMTLYNVSINRAGLQYLIELRVCRVLSRYMDDSASVELKQLSLRLLQSVTFELCDESTIEDILTVVTAKRIAELLVSESASVAATAREILSNLEKSQLSFEQKDDGSCISKDPASQRYEAKSHLMYKVSSQNQIRQPETWT